MRLNGHKPAPGWAGFDVRYGGIILPGRSGRKKQPFCAAVIAAAGSSVRMRGQNKIFALLDGEPVLVRTLRAFEENAAIAEIVVVVQREELEEAAGLCREYGFGKVKLVVPGGRTRLESVYAGVFSVSKKAELIAIHDGARPLVTDAVITGAIELAAVHHAAEPAVPVKDTIKKVRRGVVEETPERSVLYAVQTPQVFDADLIKGALQNALDRKLEITDDCMAVEAIGAAVWISPGDDENIKITTPADLVAAQAILRSRKERD